MDNNIFKVLDFCLKKQKIDDENFLFSNFFILNRWISMSHPEICKIINLTTNSWLKKTNSLDLFKFYHSVLPKYNKNIVYIKRKTKNIQTEYEDLKITAQKKELSSREIELYNQTLDFLK